MSNDHFATLFEGDLFSSRAIAVAANTKYINGLHVLHERLRQSHPELGELLLAAFQRLSILSASGLFEVASSPVFRASLDEAFVNLFAASKQQRSYRSIETFCAQLLNEQPPTQNQQNAAFFVIDPSDSNCTVSLCVKSLFQRFMSNEVATTPAELVAPTEHLLGTISAAFKMMERVSPYLSELVVLHGRNMGYIDVSDVNLRSGYREIAQSVSSHLVPSTFFISYHCTSNEQQLAEAMIHESLHKKLSNTFYAFPLMIDDADCDQTFYSYWNRDSRWNSNRWGYDRAVYAFHFYVHFMLLYEYPSYVDAVGGIELERSRLMKERASALYSWIERTWPAYLTPQGWGFLSDAASRAGVAEQWAA